MTIANDNLNDSRYVKNNLVSIIDSSIFSNNTSPFKSGGAILIINANIDILNSNFTDNYSLIGGAIRIISVDSMPIFYESYLKKNSSI